MRDWRTLLAMMSKEHLLRCGLRMPRLGFGCGYLTGAFSRQYWAQTKSGEKGKDYLKHRVMTFGTDLTPDVLHKRGLGRMEEVARRVDMHLSEDFRIRLGIVLSEYARMEGKWAVIAMDSWRLSGLVTTCRLWLRGATSDIG